MFKHLLAHLASLTAASFLGAQTSPASKEAVAVDVPFPGEPECVPRPVYRLRTDGKSKVLFLQPGGYGHSGSMGKGGGTGRPWFGPRDHSQTDRRRLSYAASPPLPASRPKSVRVCSVSERPGEPVAETVSLLTCGWLTLRIKSR